MDRWLEPHSDGVVVVVWVVPGASRDQVVGVHGDALKLRIAQPAEGGRANRAVEALLASRTGAARASLVSGATARRKRVLLHGMGAKAVAERLRSGDRSI